MQVKLVALVEALFELINFRGQGTAAALLPSVQRLQSLYAYESSGYHRTLERGHKDRARSWNLAFELGEKPIKNCAAIQVAQEIGGTTLGVWHHAEYIFTGIANARNVVQGTIGVVLVG